MTAISNVTPNFPMSPTPRTRTSAKQPIHAAQTTIANTSADASSPLNAKKIKQVYSSAPLLKPLEIIICTITVIGLFVLLGLYLGRKQALQASNILKPFLPKGSEKDEEGALQLQKDYYFKRIPSWQKTPELNEFSLADQVLCMQLDELHVFGVHLPLFHKLSKYLFQYNGTKYVFKHKVLDLTLHATVDLKKLMAIDLANVTKVWIDDKDLEKVPDSLGLLVNLKELTFNGKKIPLPLNQIQQIAPATPLLKTWEIVICTITVIGLFVLLGIYIARKRASDPIQTEILESSPPKSVPALPPQDPVLPPSVPAAAPQKNIAVKPVRNEKKLIDDILKDYPNWADRVNSWQGYPIEHQLLALQLLILREQDIKFDPFEMALTYAGKKDEDILSYLNAPIIEKAMASIKNLALVDGSLKHCHNIFTLFVNLEQLTLSKNGMIEPPNLSKNTKLGYLRIDDNAITTPPDLSQNVKLEILELSRDKLTTPPDLSKNVELARLWLDENQLTEAPDLSNNLNLDLVRLEGNRLSDACKEKIKALKSTHKKLKSYQL